ncbi:DUF4160 domain-containing protein [Jannaschia sp. LMIT008]|uniref:DUF4160 domain-containing protein n=1 Tax=Jannaschia maritima TaxID=3032585 RepID=UPI002811FC95|nr:DUF4160 domain-containing protein [Jannaschia sp. LMIT008]
MPTVLRRDGFRFFFYSNEGDPREPLHIHVKRGSAEAKFWIGPPVEHARSDGFDARTLRRLAEMVSDEADRITEVWHDHFG